jgi:hypothetical protein
MEIHACISGTLITGDYFPIRLNAKASMAVEGVPLFKYLSETVKIQEPVLDAVTGLNQGKGRMAIGTDMNMDMDIGMNMDMDRELGMAISIIPRSMQKKNKESSFMKNTKMKKKKKKEETE